MRAARRRLDSWGAPKPQGLWASITDAETADCLPYHLIPVYKVHISMVEEGIFERSPGFQHRTDLCLTVSIACGRPDSVFMTNVLECETSRRNPAHLRPILFFIQLSQISRPALARITRSKTRPRSMHEIKRRHPCGIGGGCSAGGQTTASGRRLATALACTPEAHLNAYRPGGRSGKLIKDPSPRLSSTHGAPA